TFDDDDEPQSRHWTKSRVISIAQQFGLPPPTMSMASVWSSSEDDSFETESYVNGGEEIILHELDVVQEDREDVDQQSGLHAPHPTSSVTLAPRVELV
ncbi:hypothetical protein FRB90_001722, partial [Tulasnella sp. 427]